MSQPSGSIAPRYNNVSVALHWLIAALLLAQIYVGWTFGDMERGPDRALWFDWHKALGFTILALSILRLVWRLMNPPPPFPAAMPAWERTLARINHTLFYVVLLGLPLTGWAYVSTGSGAAETGAMSLFGITNWPIIPGLPRGAHDGFEEAHEILVTITYALIVLHVGAALKHQFIDKRRELNRMPPLRGRD